MDKIYANMATIPKRIPQLEVVVNCILPQVDVLNVYLNNFEEVPWFLKKDKINIVRSQEEGDRGDAGKFYWADKVSGYYFTIDDDIAYPPDYVEALKKGLEGVIQRKIIMDELAEYYNQNFRDGGMPENE